MKKRSTTLFGRIFAFLLAAMMLMGGCTSVYAAAYQTYTYSINGFAVASPDAYTPERTLHSVDLGLETPLNTPKDIVVDDNNNVYIVDAGNNRVLVFTEYFNLRFEISSFVNGEGVRDSFSNPGGMFVTDKEIYVADTDNKRIVVFDLEGNFDRILEEPRSDVMPNGSVYRPVALSVDSAGRIYVISSTTYMGVIVLDSEGTFQSFIGAQTVTYDLLDLFWRQFQTDEQKEANKTILPTEYNNITIDDNNFIYVSSSSVDPEQQQASIMNNDGTYSPVKKLNAQGTDIMVRNGFFGPGGEVAVSDTAVDSTSITGASVIVDIACGPEGTWSCIDQKRSKVYTYDDQGNLLFVFGDSGQMLGNIQTLNGIAYQGSRILLLDRMDQSITVYNRTEYGDILINALHNNNIRNFDAAVDDWNAILQRNANFDVAYVGLGKAYYNDMDWDRAMEYFKAAHDTENYDLAFRQWRNEWVSKYALIVPVVVIAFFFVLSRFFKWAGKVNKNTSLDRNAKRSFKEEVCYAYHVMLHPFDGFWDLKHEKRGSVRAAIFFIAWAVIAFTYQQIGQAYLFSPESGQANVFIQIISVIVPLLLWVTANWCLTTLFEGEGSFRDIFIATGYALAPMPWFIIPATICTHFASLNEAGLISLLGTLGWVWTGLLIFFGVMITHDYPLFKNVVTCLGTIVGMAFIMFIAILFSTLIMRIIGFVSSLVYEFSYQMG